MLSWEYHNYINMDNLRARQNVGYFFRRVFLLCQSFEPQTLPRTRTNTAGAASPSPSRVSRLLPSLLPTQLPTDWIGCLGPILQPANKIHHTHKAEQNKSAHDSRMPSTFTLNARSLLRRISPRSVINEIKAVFTPEHDDADSEPLIHPQDIAVNPAPPTEVAPVPNKPVRRRLPFSSVKTTLLTRMSPGVLDQRLSATTIFNRTDDRSTLPSQTRLRRILRQEREHHFFQTFIDLSDLSSEASTISEVKTDAGWDGSGVETAATTPVSLKTVLRQAPGPAGPFFDAPPLKRAPALRRKMPRSQLRDGRQGRWVL